MKLSLCTPALYRVKRGQTVCEIARAFSLPPALLSSHNRLTEEVREGQLLSLPPREGHLYTVCGGESKTLLCGSEEGFGRKNGTARLYVGQTVIL